MIGHIISHYRILEKLGEGGMGIVYKAHDTKLNRTVALKFLPDRVNKDEAAKARFLKEAQAAAALNHNNICTIYGIEEHDGHLFISMEYIDGGTLREKLPFAKVDDALTIAVQIGEALQDAHAKGIVHRDIKADNIMLNAKGQAKVMDFGLAKLKGSLKLTRTSSTVGTLAYMAPEQLQGGEVDPRSDVFSFGVVLFEMLTGKMPFRGEHEAAMMYSILNEEPQPLSHFRKDIPSNIVSAISKALQKDPVHRYQNIQEMMQDVRDLSVKSIQSPKEDKSIAVLPFENMSSDPDQEYFSDGLTEEVISDLSKVHTLRVISRSSVMTFKGKMKKIPEIARELNVHYLLEGSVRKSGNNLRITAQLIEATNDAHLWSEKYSGTLDDVFDIQEKVSRSIVDALKLKLTLEEKQKMLERPIDNTAAYDCYLKAKHETFSFTKEGAEHAIKYMRNGLDIIGENSTLHAGLGLAYFQLVNLGIEQEEYLIKAREHARKAFTLDPDSPQGNAVRGYIYMLEGDIRSAISHLKKATCADPGDPDPMGWLGFFYMLAGKLDAASVMIEKTLALDPVNLNWSVTMGCLRFFEGRFDIACEHMRAVYQRDPSLSMHQFWYALCLAYDRRFHESLSILDAETGASSSADSFRAMSEFLQATLRGDRNKISRLLTPDVLMTMKRDLQYSYHAASYFSFLNQPKDALDWLENAINRGFYNHPFMEIDPFLDNIRGEDRFKKLMERAKHELEHFEV